MSMADVAAKVGLQKSSVHKILSRPAEPRRDHIKRVVARAVKVLRRTKGRTRKVTATEVAAKTGVCHVATVSRVMRAVGMSTLRGRRSADNAPGGFDGYIPGYSQGWAGRS
jgi:DNA-binding phage protein